VSEAAQVDDTHPRKGGQEGGPAYRIRRSERARQVRITVSGGTAVVVLPRCAPERLAEEMVRRHAGWVDRQLRLARALEERLAARPPLAAGRTLSVSGVPYRVRVDRSGDGQPGSARPSVVQVPPDRAGAPGELRVHLGGAGAQLQAVLAAWLRAQARQEIARRLPVLSAGVGMAEPPFSLRDQRSRWGSASRSGRLSLSWRLVLAPPYVLDYVVTHELAHLRVPGHGRRFWALVRGADPRVDEARAWLRRNHADLLAALDDVRAP
jgi:predicted metal-dependent hydrolase